MNETGNLMSVGAMFFGSYVGIAKGQAALGWTIALSPFVLYFLQNLGWVRCGL